MKGIFKRLKNFTSAVKFYFMDQGPYLIQQVSDQQVSDHSGR